MFFEMRKVMIKVNDNKKAIWITRDPGGVLYFCFAGQATERVSSQDFF